MAERLSFQFEAVCGQKLSQLQAVIFFMNFSLKMIFFWEMNGSLYKHPHAEVP